MLSPVKTKQKTKGTIVKKYLNLKVFGMVISQQNADVYDLYYVLFCKLRAINKIPKSHRRRSLEYTYIHRHIYKHDNYNTSLTVKK